MCVCVCVCVRACVHTSVRVSIAPWLKPVDKESLTTPLDRQLHTKRCKIRHQSSNNAAQLANRS